MIQAKLGKKYFFDHISLYQKSLCIYVVNPVVRLTMYVYAQASTLKVEDLPGTVLIYIYIDGQNSTPNITRRRQDLPYIITRQI